MMTPLKFIAVFAVILSTFILQGTSADRGGSEHGGGHTIVKRSFSGVLRLFPWLQHDSVASDSAAESDSSSKGSDIAQARAITPASEPHTVSKRSLDTIKPALEKVEQVLRTLPSGGFFSHGQDNPAKSLAAVTGKHQVVMVIQHPGPASLKALPLPQPPTVVCPVQPPAEVPPTVLPPLVPVVVLPAKTTPPPPAAQAVIVDISAAPTATTPPPKVIEVEENIVVEKPEFPTKPLLVDVLATEDPKAPEPTELVPVVKAPEQARNDPISISKDSPIS